MGGLPPAIYMSVWVDNLPLLLLSEELKGCSDEIQADHARPVDVAADQAPLPRLQATWPTSTGNNLAKN